MALTALEELALSLTITRPMRPLTVTKSQLDQLEERGYLDPNRRGERLDECDAIAMFLADALPKSR
jgi:hypothetical protein